MNSKWKPYTESSHVMQIHLVRNSTSSRFEKNIHLAQNSRNMTFYQSQKLTSAKSQWTWPTLFLESGFCIKFLLKLLVRSV